MIQDKHVARKKEERAPWTNRAFKQGAKGARRSTEVRGLQQVREHLRNSTPPELADIELAKWRELWQLHKAEQLPLPHDMVARGRLPVFDGADLRRVLFNHSPDERAEVKFSFFSSAKPR